MAKTQKSIPISQGKKFYGYTGTEYYSGYFSEEDNGTWRDKNRVDIVNRMRNTDGTVQAVLNAIKTPILGAEKEIVPYSQDPKDIEIAEEVEYQLFNMPVRTFEEFLREACTMFDFGHAAFEKIWGVRMSDGMIYLKDLAPRIQASIQKWEISNGEPGITQEIRSDGTYEPDDSTAVQEGTLEIPWDKLLIFTNDKEGDDLTGRSVLRSAYKHFIIKDGIYKIASVGIEKTAVGVPTGYLPEGVKVGSDEYEEFEEMLKNVRANEKQYMLMPDGYRWEFTTANGGQLGTVVKDMIEHHDRRILLAVLAEFLDLGSGAGSFALSKDQSSFFLQHVEQHAKYIASQISRYVIRQIVDYNFKDVEGYPELRFTSIGSVDFKEMAEVYKILVETGIVNVMDETERSFARKTFKLPEVEVKESPEEEPQEAPEAEPEERPDSENDKEIDPEDELAMLADEKKKTTFWRELTEPEKRVDFNLLERSFNDLEKELRDGLADVIGQAVEAAKPKLNRIISQKNLAALPDISIVPKGRIQGVLKEVIKKSYEVGKKTASDELDVKERPSTPVVDTQTIAFDASELANQMKAEIENKVKQTAKESIAKEVAVAAGVAAAVGAMMNSASTMIGNLSGITVGENINRGRSMVFQKNLSDISGFQRTEILDEKTCNMCMSLDKRIVKADDPMAKLGSVHNNCRGEWVALRTSEFETQKDLIAAGTIGIPKSVLDKFDTVGGVPVVNSFTQLKKPVNRTNEEVQDELKKRAKEA